MTIVLIGLTINLIGIWLLIFEIIPAIFSLPIILLGFLIFMAGGKHRQRKLDAARHNELVRVIEER